MKNATPPPLAKAAPKEQTAGFGKTFRHWRSGKVFKAEDYGHKVWPFGKRKK